MTIGVRLLVTYLAILLGYWLLLLTAAALGGGIGSVELLVFGVIAIVVGAYCTRRITHPGR